MIVYVPTDVLLTYYRAAAQTCLERHTLNRMQIKDNVCNIIFTTYFVISFMGVLFFKTTLIVIIMTVDDVVKNSIYIISTNRHLVIQ